MTAIETPNQLVIFLRKHFYKALIAAVLLSWSLYPWAISWILPTAIRAIVFTSFVTMVIWTYLARMHFSNVSWQKWPKLLMIVYGCYAAILMVSAFIFDEHGDAQMILRFLLKLMFFAYLLMVLTKKNISLLFDIFSNLTVALTILSLASVIGLYSGWLHSFVVTTTQGIDFHREMAFVLSGFDGNARVFSEMPNLFRVQSFAIEPGSYSLAASVALYWLIFVRESIYRTLIVACGIAASWSFGAFLGIIIVMALVFFNASISKVVKIKLLAVLLIYVLSHVIISTASTASTAVVGDRAISTSQRIHETRQVIEYLRKNPLGAGLGRARNLLKSSISVGYANAMAEAGVVGGLFYIVAFSILGWQANKTVVGTYDYEVIATDQRVKILAAIGAAVISCLFFGLQREQPDASYWHFWIYASFVTMIAPTKLSTKIVARQ